jgi:hypothetical protein
MQLKTNTLIGVLALSLMVVAGQASADLYWDGTDTTADADGGDGTWDNTLTNWDTAPTAGANAAWDNDVAVFDGTAGTVTLGENVAANGLDFLAGGYIINGGGNTITLGANGGMRSTSNPGPSIFVSDGTATINANINNNGNRLTLVGDRGSGRNAVVNGVISGSGGLATYEGIKATLSGANTYTGKTSISADTTTGSTLSVSSFNSVNGGTPLLASSSLGAPTTVANGTIDLGNGGKRASCTLIYEGAAATGETTDRVIRIMFNDSSSQTLEASGSGLLKFTSAMTSNAGSQRGSFNLRGTGTGEIVQDLPALATGGLRKLDSGTWTIAGGSISQTRVEGGTLIVNGALTNSTTVTVNSGATLAGIGTIGGDTTVSGTVGPGNSPGTLTFADNFTLNNGATYEFEGGDLIAVTGALTLTDNWTLALGDNLQDGGSITIFTYGSLTGGADLNPTFNDDNLGFTPTGGLSLTDTGSSIVLNGVSLIPEPGSLALLGLAGLMMAKRRRR